MTSAMTSPISKPENPPLLWFGLDRFWMHSHMHILLILHVVSINTLAGSSMNKIIPGATLSRNPVSHRRDKRPKPAQSNVFSRSRRLSPHPGTLIKWVPRLPTAYKMELPFKLSTVGWREIEEFVCSHTHKSRLFFNKLDVTALFIVYDSSNLACDHQF